MELNAIRNLYNKDCTQDGTVVLIEGVAPTAAEWTEINAEIVRLKAVQVATAYVRLRRTEYAKLNQDEMRYDDLVNDTTTWQAAIAAIKTKYPDPYIPTLAQAKVSQIATTNAQRDTALKSGFTHEGHLYHADPTFQSQVQGFLLAWVAGLLDPAATVAIRRKDNTTAQMTQAQVTALAGSLMQFVQGIYAASWAAKDALT